MAQLIAALYLASILAGESPTCPVEAKLAIANVSTRNDVWYGHGQPTTLDVWVALNFKRYPDPSKGAVFATGPGDEAKMSGLGEMTGEWQCRATRIRTYRARPRPPRPST